MKFNSCPTELSLDTIDSRLVLLFFFWKTVDSHIGQKDEKCLGFYLHLFQSMSVECGLNTACVKIFKKSPGFDEEGQFIPLHLRGTDVTMFRGRLFLVWNPVQSFVCQHQAQAAGLFVSFCFVTFCFYWPQKYCSVTWYNACCWSLLKFSKFRDVFVESSIIM